MSKYSEARNRLFASSRPNIRPLDMTEEVSRDLAILWAAYRKGSFKEMQELDQESFTEKVIRYLSGYEYAWMVDDVNSQYGEGKGPVGLMVARFNGWSLEPHFNPFSWITPRGNLRAVVSFLQMVRYEDGIGVAQIHSNSDDLNFFKHIQKRYGSAYYVGKIPGGDFGRDQHIFYSRGKDFYKGRKQWAA